ncbi:MAG: hypothetical protein COV74_05105 [Candidatus Omnitrophica bacterium CG11_big_fil_rev_8_21_14_0_20_45_26]|uniref:DNA polymerase III subunit delta' n=1 Tax=Candidatus Abzuiibacterium crystallinum TaxID=1974748 RepID=A0A2H0LPH3_9BACT|nr:MAG: hypothetical protein COV74_05105 [Candidatus Omnitrophica bacterium CG11_big_fil_rev_8_21_14_0_20_45_26]PIW63530.1 MAG: hypothetical protein COW12_10015 [Candidatus Omnitrophica bacterium CG12_big_fil_rev_8_21_14_0_65_45_16]
MDKQNQFLFRLLKRQLMSVRRPGGYLFTGCDHARKIQIAKAVAKAIHDQSGAIFGRPDTADAKRMEAMNHPDVHWYGLDEEERSIKIETIRELQNWLSLKPYEAQNKVFILAGAHRLTREAQNALLKSLEEPPADTLFIVMTEKKSDLLDTVVSRLIEFKISAADENGLVKNLTDKGVQGREAIFLARFSGGNSLAAHQMADDLVFKKKNNFLNAILSDPVTAFDRLAGQTRPEVLEHLNFLMTWLRDAACLTLTDQPASVIHEDQGTALKEFASRFSAEQLFELFDEVLVSCRALEGNANQKLVLARLQVKWHKHHRQTAGVRV